MKIPLYNKGLGGQGVTTGGSLGPRASYGDFTGVGQATAQLAETAGDIGYKFAIAEKKIETARMSNEEELKFINAADEYNVNSTEIDTSEYERNFTKNIVTPAMNRVERLNVSNGQKKEIKANLLKSYQIKLTKGKKFTWDRGQAVRSNASNSLIDFKLKSVSGLNENDPEFIQGVDSALKLIEDGTLQGLSIKTDREKFLQDVELGTISSKRTNATTVEDIDDLEARIKKNTKITEPQKETELNKLNTKKTKIIDNAVAFLIESPTKEIPEDGEDEEIYVSEAELFENIDSALKGDWSFNLGAQAMWNKMSTKDQGRVRAGLIAARANQQSQIKFKKYEQETKKTENVEAILNDSLPKIINGTMSAKEIYELNLPGPDGLKAINSLLAVSKNFVNNKLPTKTDLTTYAFIENEIATGKIKSPTTAFKVGEETKALSLIDRLSSKTGSISFDNYKILTGDIAKVKTSEGAKDLSEFKNFVDRLKETILGPNKNNRFNSEGNKRLYEWTVNMKTNFNKGRSEGISTESLLDPNSSNYIFTNQDFYIPTTDQINTEIASSIDKSIGITDREFKPEQIKAPLFNKDSKTVTYYDDREKSSVTLEDQSYKDLKDFKMNNTQFLNWSKTYGQIWRKQNGYSLIAYEKWLKSN